MPSRSAAGIVAVATLGALAAVAVSARSVGAIAVIAIAATGAAVVGLLIPRRPIAAFGVLFLLASFQRLAVELVPGRLRLEQPAIVVAILAIAWLRSRGATHEWVRRIPPLRPLLPFALALGVYLGALTLSSLLLAPKPVESLRMIAWTVISMLGGLVAYLLTAHAPWPAIRATLPAGLLLAGSAVVFGVAFFAAGSPIGIQGATTAFPRLTSWAHEANLLASFLAALVPFALEGLRRRPGWRWGLATVLLVASMALGITRGAWIGLGVGVALQVGLLLVRRQGSRRLLAMAAGGAVGAVVGLALVLTLLDPAPQLPRGGGTTERGEAIGGNDRTLEFRFERIPMVLDELRTSPLIGLGADSFGQRHLETTLEPYEIPAHLPTMALAVPYESGLLGSAGLVAFGLLVAWGLWRASAAPAATGMAAAHVGALATLLVAYQATNALHFGHNWLLVGAALGLIRWAALDRTVPAGTPPPSPLPSAPR